MDMGKGKGKGKARSGVMVECRICQEEGDEAYMETPCSCKGSLKYAHHRCVQRWCNEKGDTICEICLQELKPNYTAPLFRHGRNLINLRAAGEIRENLRASYGHTSDQADGASSVDSQSPNLIIRIQHVNQSEAVANARLDVCLGGRIAQELVFGEQSVIAGAEQDLVTAREIANNMVSNYWMSGDADPSHVNESPSAGEIEARILGESQGVKLLLKKHVDQLEAVANAHLDVCLGGRITQELIFGERSMITGPEQDLVTARELANNMVSNYWMSCAADPMQVKQSPSAGVVESRIIEESYERVKLLLKKHVNQLEAVANSLQMRFSRLLTNVRTTNLPEEVENEGSDLFSTQDFYNFARGFVFFLAGIVS